MKNLNDLWVTYLKGLGYTSNSLPDLMREALADQASSSSKNINDLWRDFLAAQGYTGSVNQALYDYLGSLGYSGALNDRLVQSINAGDFFGAAGSCPISLTSEDAATGFYTPFKPFQSISGNSASATAEEGVFYYVGSTSFANAVNVNWSGKRVYQTHSSGNFGIAYPMLLRTSDMKAVGVRRENSGNIRPFLLDLTSGLTVVGRGPSTTIPYDTRITFSVDGDTGEVKVLARGSEVLTASTATDFGSFADVSDFALGEDVVICFILIPGGLGETETVTVYTGEDVIVANPVSGAKDWCGNDVTNNRLTVAVTENSIVQWGSVDSVVGFSADTVIDSSNPDTNFWSGSDYYVDKWETDNTINYIWMVGGVTEIPPGATIVDARLRLKTHTSGSANGDDSFIIGVYGILPPGGIEPSQMTWNDAATGIPWTVPGAWGDLIDPVGSDYVGVGVEGDTWHEWDVTELVQLALDDNPTNMSGAFLLERADINEHGHATSYVGQTRRFWHDTGTDGSRPELIIGYAVTP